PLDAVSAPGRPWKRLSVDRFSWTMTITYWMAGSDAVGGGEGDGEPDGDGDGLGEGPEPKEGAAGADAPPQPASNDTSTTASITAPRNAILLTMLGDSY